MVAKNLLEGLVEEVRASVVGLDSTAAFHIHASHELSLGVLWYTLQDVDAYAILLLGIEDLDGLLLVADDA